MSVNKSCDECKKIIVSYSEFCVFHFQKRRDFCSQDCFFKFIRKYVTMKEGDLEW